VERVVLNALAPGAAGSRPDICTFGDPVAIVLRTRRSTFAASLTSGRQNLVWRFVIPAVAARCKLWPQNENLIVENDSNARGNRCDPDRAKAPQERKRARRVTFITSGMATLTEEVR